ncbi:MAG TPA: GGDEF domain-containing protein [Burkholderiaceae bacterium]|nr:GGDEF domain-containing protein [Burkholderiaceae bacterium]
MQDLHTVLLLIALQQGLCAVSWWVGGWRLGLSRVVSAHWMGGALATAAGLVLILERGHWPGFLTVVVANLAIMVAFVAMRRGVQIFLHLPSTDREHALLIGADALLMVGLLVDPRFAPVTVVGASVPIAWTLLRSAVESHAALKREGSIATARVVATPLALLGGLFALRAVLGVVAPQVAARPLHEANAFNLAVVLAFMLVGLLLNMVLALMVVGRLISRLQHLSERDALTGLLNRRALAPLLQREAGRLRRYDESYALLMIDVDHFKSINDRHGHAAGDAALVRLAQLLREAAREVDSVARVGGEEFCVLLPHCDPDGALQLAQRVNSRVREADWDAFGEPITVSIGLAVAQTPGEAPPAVLERADRALYRAKHAGRDRVELAEPPPAAPGGMALA